MSLPPGFTRSQPTQIYQVGDHGGLEIDDVGFWAGRQFRTFKELNIAAGAEYVIKAVVPINIILQDIEVALDDGWVRVGTYVTGSEGGAFAETLPRFSTNNQSDKPQPPYVPQVLLTAGGTHTGGVELDVLRIRVAAATGAASSVDGAQGSRRGVAANTYYFRILSLSTGVSVGVFRAIWEERP